MIKEVVKSIDLLDINDTEHAQFLFDLAHECRDAFFNDYDRDIILILDDKQKGIESGSIVAFITKVDDKKVGVIWVEKDQYDIGYLRIGIMPQYRNVFIAKYFLSQFVKFCFHTLGLRKLVATFAPKLNDVEPILRANGFKKEGYLEEELIKEGKPVDLVRLALKRSEYEQR